MYQFQGPPAVKLHVMSHRNYGVELSCVEVLNHASFNWPAVWIILPQESCFYFSALLDMFCKLLQIFMLGQGGKKRNTLCPTTTP
jgi:hypothetical protein